ncbi:UNVERIFIED_CONTAM: Translocon-associated protein subunit gamma, partial [Eudyptes robustus]|uniref:Translocon-associated protein subunit gamma n=1 Tax=Bursaphelenchus xylophilus TaxID=6326 RepID=A0A1I7S3Y5_BURXY
MSTKTKFSKEDELLLQDFSSSISTKTSVVFYVIAFLASLAPLYLFYAIHQMDVADSWFIWGAASVGVSYILAQAYKNVKHVTKHDVVRKRGEAITRDVNKQLAEDKNMSKKEKDERALWKKNEVADAEANHFTIFFNNVVFYASFIFLSFFLLQNANPIFNCLGSMYGAAGIAYLFSTAK